MSSTIAALVLAGGLVGGYMLGARRTLSPGPVAQSHAPIGMRCAQCHQERAAVVDLRCERCHDQAGSERLTNAAHVFFGSADPVKAEDAPTLECITCHVDHRGRAALVSAIDDRECASCHGFGAFGRHPEFAVVRAATSTGLGLFFPHDRHIVDSRKATGLECRSCHEPTADRRGFEPIAFDRHCAQCHLDGGVLTGQTDPLSPDAIVLPDAVAELAALPRKPQFRNAGRGRKEAVGLVHRDPWVMYNVRRFRRALDPDGEMLERVALRSRVAWLERQLTATPFGSIPDAQLAQSIRTLEADIARIDAQLAQPAQPGDEQRALEEMAAAVQTVARLLREAAPVAETADAQVLATEQPNLRPPSAVRDENASNLFEARRKELLALLAAVAARGDQALRRRAEQLQAQVARLRFEPTSNQADADALHRRLLALDGVLRMVASVADPQAQFGAAQLDALRRMAAQRVGGGLSAEEFETRRSELLTLLDSIERRGGDAVRLRTASLRNRIVAMRPGGGHRGLHGERRRRQRLLDRLKLEQELLLTGERIDPPMGADSSERVAIETTLTTLKRRLADLQSGGRVNAAATPEERERLSLEFAGLVAGCVKCHELSGAQFAPVTVAQPVMIRSLFSHAPHLTQTACDTCHRPVRRSKLATDVNSPGVANCQSCHAGGRVVATCRTCHTYHPKSLAHVVARR